MNLFGWTVSRKAARPMLSRVWRTGWSEDALPASYAERVRVAYESNAVAQRACRMVAEAVGAAPLRVTGDARVAPLIARRSAGQALVETLAIQLQLHGNAYVQMIEGADGGIGELYALRPERVTIEADGDGWPAAYLYRAGAETMRLAAEDARGRPQILHVKLPHPGDDHYGLGVLSAAASAVATHNAAGRWNRALLANAARPSGAISYRAPDGKGVLTGAQFERLKAELEESYQGAANAGRPLLLEGGLSWQAMSLTPAEMDFAALRDGAAREIACAFGVPPMLLGVPGDATYANYREAMKALWRQTVLPLGATIFSALEQGLTGWGLETGVAIDTDRVPALAEDRAALWAMVSAADFLSDAEKRAMIGMGERA
jgi:HK97 family phage portal protein